MKKMKVLLSVILLILTTQKILSQKKANDSLLEVANSHDMHIHDTMRIKALNQIGLTYYLQADIARAEYYITEALIKSDRIGYKKGLAISNALLGSLAMMQDNNTMALKYNFKALDIYRSIPDTTCLNYISKLNDIATIYKSVGLYSNSLQYYLLALRVSESIHDNHLINLFNGNIGCLYKDKGDYEKSINFYNKVLSFSIQNNDTLNNLYPNALLGLGDLYYSKNDLKNSLCYYNRFFTISQSIEDSSFICLANISIANVLKSYGDYDNAIKHLKLSLDFYNTERNSKSHLSLGQIYTAQKKYKLAYSEFEQSLAISKSIDYKNNICLVYKNLSNLDSLTKNYLGSMKNYKLYIAYNDSINNIDNEKKMLSSELNYNFEKEKSEIKFQQEEKNKITELNSKRKNMMITGIVIVLILLIIFSVIIYKSYLGKNKAHKLISYQKQLVDEKQKEIVDNITYAKRIQSAITPSNDYISQYAKQNFILHKPKDIVSGDFYWATESNGYFYLAVADCTGHGVSGAMMSMLNTSILKGVVNELNKVNTGDILNETRKEIINSLNPNGTEGVKDGMDCVLCKFDFVNKTLQYSAANNSFYIVRNGELIVCKSDKMPVGLGIKTDSFKENNIQLETGDMVYMFTDGYADQFGGDNDKKFQYKRLEQLLINISTNNTHEQQIALNEAFVNWKGTTEQTDDVLVIGVKI